MAAEILSKIVDLSLSAYGGIRAPDRTGLREVVQADYISLQRYPNPPLDMLEYQLVTMLRENDTTFDTTGFSKGRHLQIMVGFADQHERPYPEESFPPRKARQFINEVIETAQTQGRQITVPEQLVIAMDTCNGNLLSGSVVAHAGSRSIAKCSDTRVSKELNFSVRKVHAWRDSVSTFDGITVGYGSPPADNYHFWGCFTAGLVSQRQLTSKEMLLNPIYNAIYPNIAEITELLRYKLARQGDGTTHKDVDLLGFHLGSFVADHIDQPK